MQSNFLPPPPPGIRNSSFISHNLPRHIPTESLPFSTSLSRSKTITTTDEDLIQLSRELPRPAIEATLRSQLAELDALILPLRKDSERSSSLLLTNTSQSSPHDSLNIDSVLASSTNRGTAPIRLTIDLHRDLKEIHSSETVRGNAHISPKPYTPGSIFSKIERADRIETNPVIVEHEPLFISNASETAIFHESLLFRSLPVPLLISSAGNISDVSLDLEPRVFEVQRLITTMVRGSDFILQENVVSKIPTTSFGVAMPRVRVNLQLEQDLHSISWKVFSNNSSTQSVYSILDIDSIKFEQTKMFTIVLNNNESRDKTELCLIAPDVSLAFDWVRGLTILNAFAQSQL